jgi:hypothetical protein
MKNTLRFVNIRGYVKEMKVLDGQSINGEFLCVDPTSRKAEFVPEHLFYHQSPTGLVMRDSVEFKRKYPNVPVTQVSIPA